MYHHRPSADPSCSMSSSIASLRLKAKQHSNFSYTSITPPAVTSSGNGRAACQYANSNLSLSSNLSSNLSSISSNLSLSNNLSSSSSNAEDGESRVDWRHEDMARSLRHTVHDIMQSQHHEKQELEEEDEEEMTEEEEEMKMNIKEEKYMTSEEYWEYGGGEIAALNWWLRSIISLSTQLSAAIFWGANFFSCIHSWLPTWLCDFHQPSHIGPIRTGWQLTVTKRLI